MTPTPEMITLSEWIASKRFGRSSPMWPVVKDAALAAIMEVSEKVSEMADGRRTDDGSLWDAAMEDFGDAIRNGEHLRCQ